MRTATRARVLFQVLLAAAAGAVVGLGVGLFTDRVPPLPQEPPRVYPLPHHVPKYPGGVSLRFAMVHDVLHERFVRHGEAYYRERNRRARRALAEKERARPGGKRDAGYFALLDDLGAGLDYLQEHDEAVRVLRAKLRQQQARGLRGRDLYTTYANLGTFLIHGSFRQAVAGDGGARAELREGLRLIRRSIDVNPRAHFGREVWQANAVAFLLAAMDRPQLLLEYDMVGNRLAEAVDPKGKDSFHRSAFLRPGAAEVLVRSVASEDDPDPGPRESVRKQITRVGAEQGWAEAVPDAHPEPVPFDEPTLGIVGMWRLGGGANPHFALALGEVMTRVGQRYIAWCAYERAALLAGQFWPDRGVQQGLVDHCRKRQAVIEGQLPADERPRLRPRFQAELAHGQRYRQEYQAYEEKRIGEGAALDDPHFYDAFFEGREPIATPPGPADSFVVAPRPWPRLNVPAAVFFAGLFAFFGACLLRWRAARQVGHHQAERTPSA